jgi:twitching motility protein PilT
MDERTFSTILISAIKTNTSDIIFVPGQKPILRASENFIEFTSADLTPDDTSWIAQYILKDRDVDWGNFIQTEVSYEEKGLARFRASICQSRGNKVVVIRPIPKQERTFKDLNLPDQILNLANSERGLVLVTGATGQGKTTTVSSIIQQINETRKCFILTVEDPIEFIYEKKQALIAQREIGEDCDNYKQALHHGLRQHPNVIFVGEIRDAETFEAVLTAAETGHLVFSTIHTTNVTTTINRILNFYPEVERESVRNRLSENLSAVLSLRLLKRKVPNNEGKIPNLCLIPACELMVASPSISECLKVHEKIPDIAKTIESEGKHLLANLPSKMFNFDQYICKLLSKGEIDLETAKAAATKPEEVERYDILEGNQTPKTTVRKIGYDVDIDL